jgi:hypothetical protein
VPGIGNAKAAVPPSEAEPVKYALVSGILKARFGSVVPPLAWNTLSIGSQTCPSPAEHDSVRVVSRSWSNVKSNQIVRNRLLSMRPDVVR